MGFFTTGAFKGVKQVYKKRKKDVMGTLERKYKKSVRRTRKGKVKKVIYYR